MKCKNCGFEIPDKSKTCPQCGTKLSGDKFPTWVIVFLVLFGAGFFILPIIGIVAAMTIPTLISNTDNAKNKAVYKKSLATLNQALMMGEAQNGRLYSRFNDVWEKSIKDSLANLQDIPNGVIFADGTEVKYETLGNPCRRAPQDAYAHTACAILTIDANGFAKGPNARTAKTTGKYTRVNDQFKVLLYSDSVVPEKGSPEYDIIQESISNY